MAAAPPRSGKGQRAPRAQRTKTPRRPARKTAARLAQELDACFLAAEEQLARYLSDPRLLALAGPGGFRAVTLVQVGTAALYHREPGQPTQRACGRA